MNDHNNVDKQINEILDDFLAGWSDGSDVTEKYRWAAHSQILGIIKTETAKARLDELVWALGGIHEFTDDGKSAIPERIEQLKSGLQGDK